MRCPFCGTDDTQVKDSRGSEDGASIRRRRLCSSCGSRFTTFERIQLRELVVLKRNGKKSIFDREKIVRSMEIALRKRKVDNDIVERAGVTCNKNGVPFDETPPSITSGIRLGSSAATTRGLKQNDFQILGNLISDVICGFENNISNTKIENVVNSKIINICKRYPIY